MFSLPYVAYSTPGEVVCQEISVNLLRPFYLRDAGSKMLRIAHLNHIVAAIFGLHQIGNGIAVKKFIDHAV